jgi:ADP-heptose:LPS heptosyltransferase
MNEALERILVIKLGALGDLVLCCSAFEAIRRAHPSAQIALLTMPPFEKFIRKMPWFDEILIDTRPPMKDLCGWSQLIGKVRAFAPNRVYDLQGKFRQSILYFSLGGPFGAEWSGAAPLCSHPRCWPPKPEMHYTDFVAAQLERANVHPRREVDYSWLDAPVDKFSLPQPYAVLIPGCAPTRPYKRWPAQKYAELAKNFLKDGLSVVAIGTSAEADVIRDICAACPEVIDLSGKTSLFEVAGVCRNAKLVVGNDTGPVHMAGAVGTKTLSLFSDQVNPVWSSPRGLRTAYLQGHPLSDLSVEAVVQQLSSMPE